MFALTSISLHNLLEGVLAVDYIAGQATAKAGENVAGSKDVLGNLILGESFCEFIGEVVAVVAKHMVLPNSELL